MKMTVRIKRILSALLVFVMVFSMVPMSTFAAEADATLAASLAKAKTFTDNITIKNNSNDPATVVKNFKTHFTWDNEKRENSKSYLFDWSYYNGVVFEGIEYLYEVTGETVYKDYVVEYMSSLINANGGWATCSNNSSKQCAGYNKSHGADCYKTASLLLDAYEMTGDSRYLTMAKTLYADLDNAAQTYSLKNAGMNYRHTWSSDPTPDLWLDGLYMILPFRAEYAKYIGDTEELNLIVSRMQWVSDNMYNSGKKLFYHAADSATSNSGTYWLRSIGWYAAAIVDIMDHMEGSNLEAMKKQLVKLVDGMKACQNASNGMWLNNMNASKSSSNPYETSGTALTCYAVIKAVNNGWLDKSYADMAILAFNGICNEKLSSTTLKDICFKGAPGSSNSTFYDNEGKGVGPFIMFYAEMLDYVNNLSCEHTYETVTVDATCVADGTITYTCTDCGESYSETIPATGKHSYKTETVNATCGTAGSVTNTCTVCGDTSVETIPATGAHNYNCVSVDPSCTEAGSNTYTCVTCGHSYTDTIASLGHSYSAVVTAPTCDNKGFTTYTCTTCSHSYTDALTDALGHDYTSVITATCTESGYEVFTCKTCGHSYNGKEVSALGHSYTTTVVDPTCSTNGYTTYVCTGCGHSYTGNEVAASGHDYLKEVTDATCTEGGYTVFTCKVCGHEYVGNETSSLGHDYTSVVTKPTYEEMGYTTHTCKRCGDVTVDSYVPVLSHHYESETVKATCTEDGSITYTCTECGDSYVEEIPALGHDNEIAVTEADCENDGYIISTCKRCGEEEMEVIDALGHDFETVIIDPTCTADGYTTEICSVCEHMETETIPALGHDYSSEVIEPDCDDNGATVYTCDTCGDTYSEVISAQGHSYSVVSVAPTCISRGYSIYTCDTCGDHYTGDYVNALGHNYAATVTAPTCTETGFTTYTCTACSISYTDNKTAALGHSYTREETEDCMLYTCGSCGSTYTEPLPSSLTYTQASAFSTGKAYVITVKSGSKYYALSHANNQISTVSVTVTNGKITSEITKDLVWTYKSKKLSYVSSTGTTRYLYAGSTLGGLLGGSTLKVSSSNSSAISLSKTKLKVGTTYLTYSNNSIQNSKTAGAAYIFQEAN